jgi:hypothetical protein
MKVQIVTPYRVNHWQRYGITVRGNDTSVYQPLCTIAAVLYRHFAKSAYYVRPTACPQVSASLAGRIR